MKMKTIRTGVNTVWTCLPKSPNMLILPFHKYPSQHQQPLWQWVFLLNQRPLPQEQLLNRQPLQALVTIRISLMQSWSLVGP